MSRRRYQHSAYWYAYHNGWTYSEARTFAGSYLDEHMYRPRMPEVREGESYGKAWFKWQNSAKEFDSSFNPLLFCVFGMVDIGFAMRDNVSKITDPAERDRLRREYLRDLRALRRPLYYARETERRRKLAIERRKVTHRTTSAPMPTPEDVRAAWNARKESREAMIRLGGMLHDLECYVDNCLKFDEFGEIKGRNHGIKGWLFDKVPELLPKYKTLMRYKAMAVRLRQAAGVKDPTPAAALLEEKPRREVVASLLASEEPVFAHVFAALEQLISPETVFLDPAKPKAARKKTSPNRPEAEKQQGKRQNEIYMRNFVPRNHNSNLAGENTRVKTSRAAGKAPGEKNTRKGAGSPALREKKGVKNAILQPSKGC